MAVQLFDRQAAAADHVLPAIHAANSKSRSGRCHVNYMGPPAVKLRHSPAGFRHSAGLA